MRWRSAGAAVVVGVTVDVVDALDGLVTTVVVVGGTVVDGGTIVGGTVVDGTAVVTAEPPFEPAHAASTAAAINTTTARRPTVIGC
jgi:hypothetical protein